jgi:hypothetical protein
MIRSPRLDEIGLLFSDLSTRARCRFDRGAGIPTGIDAIFLLTLHPAEEVK